MTSFYIEPCHKGEGDDITKKLREVLTQCKDISGEKQIIFKKGEYHFYADFCPEKTVYASNTDSHLFPKKRSAADFSGISQLTFDGGGSSFILHGRMMAFHIDRCSDITLKNFSWDFPCAGTLEMKVMRVGSFFADYLIPSCFQWHIEKGRLHWYEKSPLTGEDYWHNIGQRDTYCFVGHDASSGNVSRYNIASGPFSGSVCLKNMGNNILRVYYLRPLDKRIYHKGMTIEISTSRKRDCVGALIEESRSITLENITCRYMHGFGLLCQMCDTVSFYGCRFEPSGVSGRLCTSFADLIHISGMKGRVHIEDCFFSHAHDDGINIHGTYTRVKKAIDKNTLLTEYVHPQQNGFVQYHPGDKVVFYKRSDLTAYDGEREFTVKSVVNPLDEGLGIKNMKVTFFEEIPQELTVSEKYVLENVTYTPEVYISGCTFESIPTRGILCTTRKKTLIENNCFRDLTMACIYLSDDCNDWYESGAIKDMTIRNNSFYIGKAPYKGHRPAVFIDPIVADKTSDNIVHRNIFIKNNLIHLSVGSAVVASGAGDITLTGNRIEFSEDYCGNKEKLFLFTECRNVTIEE